MRCGGLETILGETSCMVDSGLVRSAGTDVTDRMHRGTLALIHTPLSVDLNLDAEH